MSDIQDEIKRLQEDRRSILSSTNTSIHNQDRVSLTGQGQYDSDIYGGPDKEQYVTSLPAYEEEDDEVEEASHPSTKSRINPSRNLIDESVNASDDAGMESHYREQYGSGLVNTRISDRENEVIHTYTHTYTHTYEHIYIFIHRNTHIYIYTNAYF